MHTLRLTQHSTGENQYKVEITLEGGQFRQSAVSEFEFSLTPQDQESIRWYLEDYPLYRHDPTPKIADRVEKRMVEIGKDLFEKVFDYDKDTVKLWARFEEHLSNARIEIQTEVREATAIPWELIRDTGTDTCLALHAAAFVHSNNQPARQFKPVEKGEGPIRILLAICRPGGRNDVPFRSVASQLIKGLSEADRDLFQLDVLRPATYDALGKTLRRARDAGKPYHVVHFDGHGAFLEMDDVIAAMKKKDDERKAAMRKLLAEIGIANAHRFDAAATVYPKGQRAGKHGYLCFENPEHPENLRFVDGEDIGNLLSETGVPVLVLNACRSAHAEAPATPEENPEAAGTDPHAQTRAFGSLAQEIVNAGTAGVVAMRYNVYVVTAAQFVADLYGSLIAGNPLGKAVTLGRKALYAKPIREITGDALALQDWCVPVVYEAGPIALFPEQAAETSLKITLSDSRATPSRGHLDPELPPTPDAGFWGRDETLLALDRAFVDHGVLLLHAYAGSGKTAAVAEFARWYALTGGVQGPVLFTSFEQYKPLARVLDKFGQVFGPTLEQQAGINWLARSDGERREIALQVMGQVPVLWIWDNVEPVAGFPTGAASAWSADEQKELADFLRAARGTKAKFLLTSRRNEKPWLADLPVRITLPAMPMHEREQMARGLAKKHGRGLRDLKAWRPLLRFTGGNPLTITVLAGQALRDGLTAEEQIEGFVEKLSRGETAFEDEETECRDKSLASALNYGFENAFSEDERRILALLYFFQGFVNEQVLRGMGSPELVKKPLQILRNQTRNTLRSLLDKVSEVGLLTILGGGYYTVHPALPWFFKGLFDYYYEEDALPARAFIESVGALGDYYHRQYADGNRDVLAPLIWEESNFLHARRMARDHGLWFRLTGTMQGLNQLYGHFGRRGEWKRLVEEIVPDFIVQITGDPIAGREDQLSMVVGYCVRLAKEERDWAEAERLQTADVKWCRKRAASYLNMPLETIEPSAHNVILTLAASLHELGQIHREKKSPECVEYYKESLEISNKIGEKSGAASCALNIGHAYKDIHEIRNMETANHWYAQSLKMRDESDRMGRSKCLSQMGTVAFERFKEAQKAKKPEKHLVKYVNEALHHYSTALSINPTGAINDLHVNHGQLGRIYGEIGQFDKALLHYQKSINIAERTGNTYGAGQYKYWLAVTFAEQGNIQSALDYAHSAAQDFAIYGDRSAAQVEEAKKLIQKLSELG